MKTEDQLIAEMEMIIQRKLEEAFAKGHTQRGAHPKTQGLLKAKLMVPDNLPDDLSVGIFQKGAQYDTLVRCSNGKSQSDKEKDFRGMALKLLGIKGERLNDHDLEDNTQDFILITTPIIAFGTVKEFRDSLYIPENFGQGIFSLKMLATSELPKFKKMSSYAINSTSPMDVVYFSSVPYQFGQHQVKYKLIPTSAYKSTLPDPLNDSYVKDNMIEHLSKHDATFDFCIQKFVDEKTTPVEDASVEWEEKDSPFIKIAELHIPKQNFDLPERYEFAENLSFSPGHSLKVHQPIGGINRARIQLYTYLSKFRHARNDKPLDEPKPIDFMTMK